MTNLIDITDLSDSDLDALMGAAPAAFSDLDGDERADFLAVEFARIVENGGTWEGYKHASRAGESVRCGRKDRAIIFALWADAQAATTWLASEKKAPQTAAERGDLSDALANHCRALARAGMEIPANADAILMQAQGSAMLYGHFVAS